MTFIPEYEGIKPPILEINQDEQQGENVLKLSYNKYYQRLFPYIFNISKSSEGRLPNQVLLFYTSGDFYKDGGFSVKVFSEFNWLEEQYQYRLKLRPEVEFYQWNEKTNSVQRFPVTEEDIVFSFETHRKFFEDTGYGYIYEPLTGITIDEETKEVVLQFSKVEKSKITQMVDYLLNQGAILPKKIYGDVDLEKIGLSISPVGIGPYYLKKEEINSNGAHVKYHRVQDHWLDKVFSSIKEYNFQTLEFKYFSDTVAETLGLTSGEVDYVVFTDADSAGMVLDLLPENRKNEIVITEIPSRIPSQLWLNFNLLSMNDEYLRKAIALMFRDFSLLNLDKKISKSYKPNDSLYPGSIYYPTMDQLSDNELYEIDTEVLQKLSLSDLERQNILEILKTSAQDLVPVTERRSDKREMLRQVNDILDEAGYKVIGGKRINPKTGQPLVIRALSIDDTWLFNLIQENFERMGIELKVIVVDGANWRHQIESKNFDIYIGSVGNLSYPSPVYLESFFHSKATFVDNNGLKDKVLDALIEGLMSINNINDTQSYIKALNKVVIGKYYLTPIYYSAINWLVHSPTIQPKNKIDNQWDARVTRGWGPVKP